MSNNSLNLKFVLQAVDHMTAPVRRMRESINNTFGRIKSSVGFMGFAIQYHLYHARKAINAFGEKLKENGQKISEIGSNLMTRLTLPILALGGVSVKSAAQVEQVTMQIRRLVGDAGKAEEIVKRLEGYKALDFADAADSFKALLAAGYSAESAFKRMDFLGEVASGSGNQLKAMTDMYIGLRKNGKATAADLFSMMNANIPIAKELGKQLGKSEQRIYQMAEAEMITFAQVKKALESMAGEGGRFGGSMEEVSNSIIGSLKDIARAFTQDLAPLGRDIWKALDLGERIRDVASGVRRLVNWFSELPDPVKKNIINITLFAAAVAPVIFLIGQAVTALSALVLAFGFLLNPIALVGIAVAGFAVAGYMLVKHWDKVKAFFIDLWEGIKGAFMTAIKPITDLIDSLTEGIRKMMDRLSNIKRMVTDNALTRAWDKYFGDDDKAAASASAPARNMGIGGVARVDTGGTLNIKVDQDGRVTDVGMRPNDRRQNVNINTGLLVGSW